MIMQYLISIIKKLLSKKCNHIWMNNPFWHPFETRGRRRCIKCLLEQERDSLCDNRWQQVVNKSETYEYDKFIQKHKLYKDRWKKIKNI